MPLLRLAIPSLPAKIAAQSPTNPTLHFHNHRLLLLAALLFWCLSWLVYFDQVSGPSPPYDLPSFYLLGFWFQLIPFALFTLLIGGESGVVDDDDDDDDDAATDSDDAPVLRVVLWIALFLLVFFPFFFNLSGNFADRHPLASTLILLYLDFEGGLLISLVRYSRNFYGLLSCLVAGVAVTSLRGFGHGDGCGVRTVVVWLCCLAVVVLCGLYVRLRRETRVEECEDVEKKSVKMWKSQVIEHWG